MESDEHRLRQGVADWLDATRRGDIDRVLGFIDDDALFLTPGQPPMDKAAYEAASRAMVAAGLRIDGRGTVEEVQVAGDWAWLRCQLSVEISRDGAAPMRRAGPTLSVFRRRGGEWLLARDANLLAPVDG